MERVLEPEVMETPESAAAYAAADFSAPNQAFVERLLRANPGLRGGRILDIGCGPADIPIRLARALPGAALTGADASPAMLAKARAAVGAAGLAGRVKLVEGRLPGLPVEPGFDAVVSNSVLHHMPDPPAFWGEILRLAKPGAAVLVMDLFRPESARRAREIVEAAARDEHPILKEDFYNSLLAAFSVDEVNAQLRAAGLGLRAEAVSDRHWAVCGAIEKPMTKISGEVI
jgi:ubiquinone/menaquinone biosynthesis C-methylase UbiE